MTTAPFSQALRERTWNTHNDTEGATFMSDLMRGAGTRDDYIALVAQHYFMYEALERV
ncbi:MAG TPA: biliverdin-producing heme oxygenase, partial [Terrimesophilobacter sp.]|nr:biliverdin-producing heme oxygenase [Terrimesophilobacter sp.]